MKIQTCFCIIFLISVSVSAQSTRLRFNIKNEKNEPVENATLALYQLPDTILSSKKVFKPESYFDVKLNTDYVVKITAVGKEDLEKIISIGDSSITVSVVLKNKINELANVTVVSKKPLIKHEDDKMIVDAEPLVNSSTNAYEVLEKTPTAVIDQDGNVYLNSATPATIQINGREVKLSAQDLASLLKSLPANSVTKIEIIRTPSAKYDAGSSGGIVNIVLKKGIKLGTSGSVNAGYFQGKYHTAFAGFNLNKSIKKINTYTSFQFIEKNTFEELSSRRFINTDNSVLAQNSFTKYQVINNYLGAGADVEFNKKWSMGYDLRLTANNNKSNATNDIDILTGTPQNISGKNQSIILNRGASYYLTNNFYTKFKIDSTGSEWTFDLDYNYFRSTNEQTYNNLYFLPARPALTGDGNLTNNKNILTAQTDVVIKLKNKLTVESGLKFNYSASRNSALYFYETNGSGRQADNFQTNKFRYNENISAAYLQVSKTFLGITIKPGIRAEAADISGRQLFPKDTSLNIRRTDFFPYLYLRRGIVKLFGFMLTGNAIYRRSTTRPYYEALNPYPKYIDQYLYDVGNPKLEPQFTTNYEFNIMADDFPVFSIGVNETKAIFTNVTYQDDVTRIAYRTFDNLGTNKEMYLRFVGGIPPGKKYFFYAGAQHNLNNYKGFYQNAPLNYKNGSWTIFSYHNYKITPVLNITMNGFMRIRGLQNFYELKTFGSLNLSANRSFLKKKANVIVSVNDIFGTNKYDFTLQQGSVSAIGRRVNDTKRVGVTLRYNFGFKPKEEKKNNFEVPE